jgi:low density lipoprotein receptor-related protein 5/6
MSRCCLQLLLVVVAGQIVSPACWAVGREKMYWSDRGNNKIHRANLDGTDIEVLASGMSELRGVAVDLQNHRLYWADNGANKIQRSLLDGTQVEDLVTTGLSFPAGIALDVPGDKMYWADATTRKIQRANLDGSNVQDLVTGLGSPYFVTLDLENDSIYWTDYGTQKIQRSNLDGSNVVDIITTGLNLPRGVDLDLGQGKLYWADRGTDWLQRSNLDGTQIEDLHLATPSSAAPHGVAVDPLRQQVYWVDNGVVTIERMNADGSDAQVILGADSGVLDRPWQIVLDLRTASPTCVPGYPCTPGDEDQRIDAIAAAVLNAVNDPQYDYDRDGQVSDADRGWLVDYVLNSTPGDANLDGHFNSGDLVLVLAEGRYEDAIVRNAGWKSGDWTGDLEFDSKDLVAALATGQYETGALAGAAAAVVPEPSGWVLGLGLLVLLLRRGVRPAGVLVVRHWASRRIPLFGFRIGDETVTGVAHRDEMTRVRRIRLEQLS